MRTLLRSLLYLALIVWLGAEIFFPIVAAVVFTRLMPDTHLAGTIVGTLLRILHGMGLASGLVAMAMLALAPALRIYTPRSVLLPMGLLLAMIGCTVYSQFGIIPAMERDRIAAGGAIDAADGSNPNVADFNRLHNRSETVEEAIDLMGLATVILVAWAESHRTAVPAPLAAQAMSSH
jgi:hypothetical protein